MEHPLPYPYQIGLLSDSTGRELRKAYKKLGGCALHKLPASAPQSRQPVIKMM
jgi:hypothetical protein